ncbi:dapper homolog 2 [Heterodontus francisci]|uniref:dapper homolog 2 n=1 Tax=Heterodontus francisci TaxID=7792 RepID=UPI00355C897B
MLNRRHRSTFSAAFDRCRAGERLQAALAGLQELDLLKQRQRQLVRAALETETPRAKESYTEEERLETTLNFLKEQLSHLRKQDVGLKIHLLQLDRQISELKLDVNKASTEQLESDSRPSSGFYELSDAGSCSLSNSCTSMYSESTSSSQGSLLYCSQSADTKGSRLEDRPRSADEVIVQSAAFKQQGPGRRPGRGIKTTAEPVLTFNIGKLGVPRPRPVSTGDLERFVPSPQRDPPSVSNLNVCPSVYPGSDLQFQVADQKYQRDLVSKSSSEVYNYPSPLHALALQSPLFCLTEQVLRPTSTTPPNPASRPVPFETRPGHVNKQTQRCSGGINKATMDRDPETSPKAAAQEKDISLSTMTVRGRLEKLGGLQWGRSWRNEGFPVESAEGLRQQEATSCSMIPPSTNQRGHESKAASSDYPFRLRAKALPVVSVSGTCSGLSDSKGLTCELPQRTNQRSGGTAGKGGEAVPKSEFVHAKFVPAESRHRVQVLSASGKTKVAKIKKRNSETARAGKRLTTRAAGAFRSPAEGDRACRSAAMVTASAGLEAPGRSCSESSLHPMCDRLEFQGRALCGLPTPTAGEEGTMAKQWRWQSSIEIFPRAPASQLCFGPQRQRAGRRWAARMMSFSRARMARHPGARSESDQSEYSAECASLFHSTIAESSGDECSDHTANCFGDSESSGSEGCPSVDQVDGRPLVWPEGAGSRGLRSEARICRIKASKALKKKIRRFQPEALKVMTMV